MQQTHREKRQYSILIQSFFLLEFLIDNQTKHMHIQDTFHSDGLSYESGDELSETESDFRSSEEKLDRKNSSPTKDQLGNYCHTIYRNIFYVFLLKS